MISGLQFEFNQHHQPEIHIESVREVSNEITSLLYQAAFISTSSPVEATHLFRKRLKLYRAYLKLLRPCSSDELYKTANIFLRDLGKRLSDLRDAHVRDLFLTEISHNQEFSPYHRLLTHLLETNRITVTNLKKERIIDKNLFPSLGSALEKSREIENFFNQLKPEANRLLSTFVDTIRASRDAFKNCSLHLIADDLHEWRKRLKDVQYQIEILAGTEIAQHQPLYTQVSEIGDTLGQINDTHMIMDWVISLSIPTGTQTDLPRFLGELKELKNSGISLAVHKGEKLYSLTNEQLEVQATAWL